MKKIVSYLLLMLSLSGCSQIEALFTFIEELEFEVYLVSSSTEAGSVSISSSSVTFGDTTTITATPKAGYVFAGWSGDITSVENPLDITVNSNMNITANFIPKYTIDEDFTNAALLIVDGDNVTGAIDGMFIEDKFMFEVIEGSFYKLEQTNPDYIMPISVYNSASDLIGNDITTVLFESITTGFYYASVKAINSIGNYSLSLTTIDSVSTDKYEPNNSFEEATPLIINGETQNHTIHIDSDIDYLKIGLTKGTWYTISNHNSGSWFSLYDSQNNDLGGNSYEKTFQASVTGDYYIRFGGDSTGDYSVSIISIAGLIGDKYEDDNDFDNATVLTINADSQLHSIHYSSDEDYFQFELTEGKFYEITKTDDTSNSTIKFHNQLTWEMTSSNSNSNLIVDCNETGTYYVSVLYGNIGNYSIAINEIPAIPGDDYEENETLDNATILEVNGLIQDHTIHTSLDRDYVKFDLNSGTTNTLSILDSTASINIFLFNQNNECIDIWNNFNTYSDLIINCTKTGTYYCTIVGVERGDYSIRIVSN